MTKCHILVVINLLFLFQNAKGEVFTAMADLEDLLDTEQALISTLENYVRAEEQKLDLLRRYVNIYRNQHGKAIEDVQLYLANPINAYTLVKRLTADWTQVEALISTNINTDALANITYFRENMKFPNDEDLNGAAVALTRLQDTYGLDTSSLARGTLYQTIHCTCLLGQVLPFFNHFSLFFRTAFAGGSNLNLNSVEARAVQKKLPEMLEKSSAMVKPGELNGVKYSAELTAADCFELGRQSYNNGDFYHTQLWMEEAEARLKREANDTVDRSDILEYLAFSTYKQGNVALALDLTNKLLDIIPTHSRALGNRVYYEDELKELNKKESDRKKGDDGSENIEAQGASYEDPFGRELYEGLCRGEVTQPPQKQAKLKCKYLTRDNPFLKIAPFKVEVAHLEPDLYIFHDVMSDVEIDTIKRLAYPRFKRATVQNSQTGALETAQYRISKSSWLRDEEDKHIANVAQRVSDITGLTMETAEELQVVNYGIGGHYEPHFDFARKEEKNAFKNLGTGNRIATVLFYMTDVPQGGATVFPVIKAAVWPKKGTAAFWYNLFPSGDGDVRTRHAACPVLAGSKWVSNKWIHERGQEFLRPCTKDPPPKELTA